MSPKKKKKTSESIAYASGEKLVSEKISVNVERFFGYVVGFMVFDILVFVFASFMEASNLLPIIYICIVFVTTVTFIWMVKTDLDEFS